ncbi:hypothetical protein NW762_011074 [Fusarium torreyae]|uniref:Metallo-beta-lactamase domain-containing protein n=1 Tax=Fusarium torreyae TaxID=1237075 RepID=A0A9W8VB20_9HYPO|nr:hypothetical protein NW762_011074 [Fusarium torreyae]
MASTFNARVEITHIGTATAILTVDGVTFLTDPFFSPAGSRWPTHAPELDLAVHKDPALKVEELPHIDAVLLSHENHIDNLDQLGRKLLDGRYVVTTNDGAKNLAPRPSVFGFNNWQERKMRIGGKIWTITATPCTHIPGHECVGFILAAEDFGIAPDGRRNAIYFTGDTIYVPELAKMADKYHIAITLMNLGKAILPRLNAEGEIGNPNDTLQITMDGSQAARLMRDIKSNVLVPMHFDDWDHFTQHGKDLAKEFEREGILDMVKWLKYGEAVRIN